MAYSSAWLRDEAADLVDGSSIDVVSSTTIGCEDNFPTPEEATGRGCDSVIILRRYPPKSWSNQVPGGREAVSVRKRVVVARTGDGIIGKEKGDWVAVPNGGCGDEYWPNIGG